MRYINGVSPEDADSSSVSGLGSENRTRFLDLLGVAGGVTCYGIQISRLED
jgi:hypothetical protein